MSVPVGGRGFNSLFDLFPTLEATAFGCEGAKHLPPRFDQVEIGGIGRLEDKLPPRMVQAEE